MDGNRPTIYNFQQLIRRAKKQNEGITKMIYLWTAFLNMGTKDQSYDEQALVTRLRTGDRQSMEELYDRYSKALYGIIFRVVDDEVLAEDLLQDSFVKIWKNIPKYEASKGRLFTWMLNIARNSAVDAVRSKGFRDRKKVQNIDQAVYKDPENELNISNIGVRELLVKLKPEQRIIIDMIYFKGYTQAEVAETLNVPLGTVKSRVKIAMRELKKVFN